MVVPGEEKLLLQLVVYQLPGQQIETNKKTLSFTVPSKQYSYIYPFEKVKLTQELKLEEYFRSKKKHFNDITTEQ